MYRPLTCPEMSFIISQAVRGFGFESYQANDANVFDSIRFHSREDGNSVTVTVLHPASIVTNSDVKRSNYLMGTIDRVYEEVPLGIDKKIIIRHIMPEQTVNGDNQLRIFQHEGRDEIEQSISKTNIPGVLEGMISDRCLTSYENAKVISMQGNNESTREMVAATIQASKLASSGEAINLESINISPIIGRAKELTSLQALADGLRNAYALSGDNEKANDAIDKAKKEEASRYSSKLIAQRPDGAGTDIVVEKENKVGNTFIVGDMHGEKEAFDKVCQLLKTKDDVLYVIGDLADRGSDSRAVIKKAMSDSRIRVVRGNHEELFLRAMQVIERFRSETNDGSTRVPTKDEKYEVAVFLKNGGDWILDRPDKIRQPFTPVDDYYNYLHDYAGKVLMKQVSLISDTQLKGIKEYFEKLPYIRVTGDTSTGESRQDAFLLCHADMPLNDSALKKRIAGSDGKPALSLTDSEKGYITWARMAGGREVQIKDCGRTKNSIPVYCGHDIVTKYDVMSVRDATNHRNLDFGSYLNGVPVVVNHKENKVILCVTSKDAINNLSYKFYTELVGLSERIQIQNADKLKAKLNNRIKINGDDENLAKHFRKKYEQKNFEQDIESIQGNRVYTFEKKIKLLKDLVDRAVNSETLRAETGGLAVFGKLGNTKSYQAVIKKIQDAANKVLQASLKDKNFTPSQEFYDAAKDIFTAKRDRLPVIFSGNMRKEDNSVLFEVEVRRLSSVANLNPEQVSEVKSSAGSDENQGQIDQLQNLSAQVKVGTPVISTVGHDDKNRPSAKAVGEDRAVPTVNPSPVLAAVEEASLRHGKQSQTVSAEIVSSAGLFGQNAQAREDIRNQVTYDEVKKEIINRLNDEKKPGGQLSGVADSVARLGDKPEALKTRLELWEKQLTNEDLKKRVQNCLDYLEQSFPELTRDASTESKSNTP